MILLRRFLDKHIQRGTGDLLRLQRLGQRKLIHHFPARVIDDQQIRLAPVEQPIAIQQMPRAFTPRNVEGDDIQLGDEFVEIPNEFDPAIQRGRLTVERIETDDGHLHRQRPRRDRLPDAAQADDPERLARQLSALIFRLLPFRQSGFHMRISRGNFTGQAHHQSQRMLRGGKGRCGGGVEHENALGGRGIQIDVVHAHPGPRDGFQNPGILQHLGGDFRAGANHQRIVLPDNRRQFVFLQPDLGVEGMPGLLKKIQSLFRQLVSHENAHGKVPSKKTSASGKSGIVGK